MANGSGDGYFKLIVTGTIAGVLAAIILTHIGYGDKKPSPSPAPPSSGGSSRPVSGGGSTPPLLPASNPPQLAPVQPSAASSAYLIEGTWQSSFGPVTIRCGGSTATTISITGHWDTGSGQYGTIVKGTFYPSSKSLNFDFTEPSGTPGSASFTLSADNQKLEGSWAWVGGGNGGWTMYRR